MPQEVETVLREAVKDLLYMSESDEPFEVVFWRGSADCSDPRDLLGRTKAGTTAPIEAVSRAMIFHLGTLIRLNAAGIPAGVSKTPLPHPRRQLF